jgi:hypothetical protein
VEPRPDVGPWCAGSPAPRLIFSTSKKAIKSSLEREKEKRISFLVKKDSK